MVPFDEPAADDAAIRAPPPRRITNRGDCPPAAGMVRYADRIFRRRRTGRLARSRVDRRGFRLRPLRLPAVAPSLLAPPVAGAPGLGRGVSPVGLPAPMPPGDGAARLRAVDMAEVAVAADDDASLAVGAAGAGQAPSDQPLLVLTRAHRLRSESGMDIACRLPDSRAEAGRFRPVSQVAASVFLAKKWPAPRRSHSPSRLLNHRRRIGQPAAKAGTL